MSEVSVVRRGMVLIVELVKLSPLSFTISVLGAAVFAAGTVGSTLVLGRVTDDVVLPTFDTGEVPPNALAWSMAAVIAVTIVRAAGVVMRRYFAGMTAERAQVRLRHRLVDHYLGLPLSWHQRTPTGLLLAHADNDTDVTTEVIHPLPFSIGAGFLAVFSAVALVAVDPIIAVVALAIFPALTAMNRIYSGRIERPAAEVQAGVGRVSTVAHESFDGALVVKTLGRAPAESDRFTVATRDLQERRRRVGYIRAGFEAAMDALPNLGIVVVVVIGASRIQAGAMTQGDLVQVASLFTVLALPMRVFGFFLEMVPPSVVSRARLATVFGEALPEPVVDDSVLSANALQLEARALHFGYSADSPVLADVSFVIEPGEVVAVVGSTGSGKTTLCTLLAGLVPPSGGMVLVDGRSIDRLSTSQRTEAIGLVFQEAFLFADTVRANVDLTGSATDAELEAVLAVAQVDRFLSELPEGLDTVLGERGVTLSGGQRQRVALARALLAKPSLLLLDDATSAVDALVEQEILAGLRSKLEATTVIVAQRLSTIELADRVLYLSGGRIAADGAHEDLLRHPGYEALVRAYEETVR